MSENTRPSAATAVSPFLKWAGGKRWLTAQYSHLFPHSFERYFEPFLGSGAAFFFLRPTQSVLADKNSDLVNAYRQIRSNWRKVSLALRRHHLAHSKLYYYEERNRLHKAEHEKAAQFIYLNRTCWNGLYRVNLRGEFNVPIGTKSSVLLNTDNFEETACLLRRANLLVSDFEEVIDSASDRDFVFVDPPYVTRHNFNGFVKYNDHLFSWRDQERLVISIVRAMRRGVKLLVTNAAHRSVRELYKGIGTQLELRRTSVIAADPADRGVTTEVAIMVNYTNQVH